MSMLDKEKPRTAQPSSHLQLHQQVPSRIVTEGTMEVDLILMFVQGYGCYHDSTSKLP